MLLLTAIAWKIPWTEEPGGLQSIGPQRVGRDRSNLVGMHATYTCGDIYTHTYINIYTDTYKTDSW